MRTQFETKMFLESRLEYLMFWMLAIDLKVTTFGELESMSNDIEMIQHSVRFTGDSVLITKAVLLKERWDGFLNQSIKSISRIGDISSQCIIGM